MGKFMVQGRDAGSFMNYISANEVNGQSGRITYTQWLNDKGGIEADLTVTRLDSDCFLIVTAAETQIREFDWLKQHIPADANCVLTDVTSAMGVI